jgi:hypothetical protein
MNTAGHTGHRGRAILRLSKPAQRVSGGVRIAGAFGPTPGDPPEEIEGLIIVIVLLLPRSRLAKGTHPGLGRRWCHE